MTKPLDNEPLVFSELEKLVAQKITLDIRHFAQSDDADEQVGVTELPAELAEMITQSNLGSVVLFAENFANTEQVVKLTHDLQQAALASAAAKPLIISVDQEGGRVFRFAQGTAFAGNMALGATQNNHGVKLTEQANTAIAKELLALGINNNYAPVVDVNNNSKNPVINTRAYGDKPDWVAKHGIAATKAIQVQGVMATLKHFPGHGDTYVDSHLGLPRVDHELTHINANELVPFKQAIANTKPAMIMTAHIQYPVLDSSTFTSTNGDELIKPATMSRKILHDLLRVEMNFDGIIATDALDMAGIAHFYQPVDAVVATFVAGADLAVMPFKVRKPSDINKFYHFIKQVAAKLGQKIEQGEITQAELEQSLARINRYKADYINSVELAKVSLAQQQQQAQQVVANSEHLALEQSLMAEAVVLAKTDAKLLPLASAKPKNIHIIVENDIELAALSHAIEQAFHQAQGAKANITALVASKVKVADKASLDNFRTSADLVIASINVRTASLVDLGGMDDLLAMQFAKEKGASINYADVVEQQLVKAQQAGIKRVVIARGSPYLMSKYTQLSNVLLCTFDDRSYLHQGQALSPGYNASLAILLGNQAARGMLPVQLS